MAERERDAHDRVARAVVKLVFMLAAVAAAWAFLPIVLSALLSTAGCRRWAHKGVELVGAVLVVGGLVAWYLLAHPHLDWRPGSWAGQLAWGVPLGVVAGFLLSRRKKRVLRVF